MIEYRPALLPAAPALPQLALARPVLHPLAIVRMLALQLRFTTPAITTPELPQSDEVMQIIGPAEDADVLDDDASAEDQRHIELNHAALVQRLAERLESDTGPLALPAASLACDIAANAERVTVQVVEVRAPPPASSSDTASCSKPRIANGFPQPLFVGHPVTRGYNHVASALLPLLQLHSVTPRLIKYHGDPSGSPAGMSKFTDLFVGGEEWQRIADGSNEYDWVGGDDLLVGGVEPLVVVATDDADGATKPVLYYGPDFTAVLPDRPFRLMGLAHAPSVDAFLDALLPLPSDHPPYSLREVLGEASGKWHHYSHAFHYFVAWHAYSWMALCWLRKQSKRPKKGGPPRVWGKVRPVHTPPERYGTWKSALVYGVLLECLPYAVALHKTLLTPEEQKRSAALPEAQLYDSFFSYIGLKIYGDSTAANACPAIVVENRESNINLKAGTSRGLVLHFDNSNHGFGYIFVFGTYKGFEQLYPKLGLKLICPTLAYTVCEFDKILHGVGEGRGVRMCVVFACHRAMAVGQGVEGAPYTTTVDFSRAVFAKEK